MGIKEFFKYFNRHEGACVNMVSWADLKGKTVAIDASISIHRAVYAVRSKGSDLTNKEGELTSHLINIIHTIVKMLSFGIKPIYVFDGKPIYLKRSEREKRRNRINENLDEMMGLEVEDERFQKLYKQTYSITEEQINQTKMLLDLMGVPYIQSPHEADPVCVWLTLRGEGKNTYAHMVMTEDSDLLVLGAPYLLRKIPKSTKMQLYNRENLLKALNMNNQQFVTMCSLMGTDYCKRLRGFGPGNIEKLLQNNHEVQDIFDLAREKNPNETHEENENCIRDSINYFLRAVKSLDHDTRFVISQQSLQLRKLQELPLLHFMIEQCGFAHPFSERIIRRLLEYQNKMNVTLENHYQYHVKHIVISKPESDMLDSSEA